MYFKYPYSDMYALNLDWMIKAINEVQEIIGELGEVVNSVNGESGDVTISAEMVNATNINGTFVTTNDPSNQPQSVLAAYYGNGIRVILVRNNLGAIDRCFFLSKHDSVFNLVEYVPTSSQSGVRLINGLNGDVTLTGENIMLSASDQRTIAVVIAALNNRVGTLETNVGDLTSLETYNKASLVAAINELVQTNDTIFEDIGDISNLQVEAGNLVSAVNINTAGIRNLGPYNGLDSNSTIAALSAAQGKILKDEKAIGFDLAFESGITFSGSYKYVYKYHNIVIINGIIELDSYTANYTKTVAILPAAVRPGNNYIDTICWCDSGTGINITLGRLLIYNDGRIQVYSNTTNTRYAIHAVYTTT